MNKAQWIAQKNHLCILIKKVSEAAGGDDQDFLRDYCKEILRAYHFDLETALQCFLEIEKQLCKK